MSEKAPIGIAGTGKMAQALGRLLREVGCPVSAVAGRDRSRTEAAARFVGARAADLQELPRLASRLLVAVSDDAIAWVAETLARAGARDGVALHTSGAHGPEALAPLAEAGFSCGALHPLQTVASPAQGVHALRGAAFVVTAEGPAAEWAGEIVRCAQGCMLAVPAARRATYHAAAVLASNCFVALLDAALELLKEAGVERTAALRALAPLVRASCENVLALGPAAALTGPVRRGDVETVRRHWRALGSAPGSLRELYRACSLRLVELARQVGLEPAAARQLEEVFRGGDGNDA